MAASLTGTFGHATGTPDAGRPDRVAMIGRPSLSRPVTPRQRPGTSAARHFSPAGAGYGGRPASPRPPQRVPRRLARPPRRHEPLAKTLGRAGERKDQAMNTNAGAAHRLQRLPGPAAVRAAFAATVWAAVPTSRGSPPGRCLTGSGLLAAPRAAGTAGHAAAERERRRS